MICVINSKFQCTIEFTLISINIHKMKKVKGIISVTRGEK